MRRLIDFVLHNPILLIVLVLWIGGLIGNIVKATRRARERAEAAARRRHGELPSGEARTAPPEPHATVPRTAEARPTAARHAEPSRSTEEVAREMRRILGVEEPSRGDVTTAREPASRQERTLEHPVARATRERAEREARVRAERAARAARQARPHTSPPGVGR